MSLSSSSTFCQEKVQPQILTLKLAPLKSDFAHQSPQNEEKMDGWSLIQSLTTNPAQPCIYVHPLVKRSTDKLSANSLEMCTEILGNETGSDLALTTTEEFNSFLLQLEGSRIILDNNSNVTPTKRSPRSRDVRRAFPPPLTSMSSKSTRSIRLRPHREGGRFVLRAHTIPSCKEVFHAERSNGHLRLRFDASSFCSKAGKEEEGKFEDNDEVDDDDNEDEEDDVIEIDEKILWTNKQGCKEWAQRSKGFWNVKWDSYWVATN